MGFEKLNNNGYKQASMFLEYFLPEI